MSATQRRGRRIMMSDTERDAYLTGQRTCRVATVSAEGRPHVGALWFVWDGTSLWLYSLTRQPAPGAVAAEPGHRRRGRRRGGVRRAAGRGALRRGGVHRRGAAHR